MKAMVLGLILLLVAAGGAAADGTVQATWYMDSLENYLDTRIEDLSLAHGLSLNVGVGLSGQMENTDGFGGEVNLLSLKYMQNQLSLWAGKQDYALGRARLNPVFLGGGRQTAFLSMGYSFGGENWDYTRIYGDLSVDEDYKRVGIHYVTFRPLEFLSIGLGEAMVTEETFDGDFLYYTLPFMPYYASKYIPGISSKPNNSLMYIDAEAVWETYSFYGEVIAGEFPMTPSENNPALFAFTLGVEAVDLLPQWTAIAEYSQVRNHVYSNRALDTTYSIGNRSIGHPQGDDVESLNLQFSRQWDDRIYSEVGVFYRGWGDNDLIHWPPSDETSFLGGTPERLYGLQLAGSYAISPELKVAADLEFGQSRNYDHKEGEIGYRYGAALRFTWDLF